MKKLMLLLPFIVALSSCKKEDKISTDRILIHSFCQDCTIKITSNKTGKTISKDFKESVQIDELYDDLVPFVGTVILKTDKPGAFIISASIRDENGIKRTAVLMDKAPEKLNTEVQFNSNQISN